MHQNAKCHTGDHQRTGRNLHLSHQGYPTLTAYYRQPGRNPGFGASFHHDSIFDAGCSQLLVSF